MSIKSHLLTGEEVLGHCSTKYWTWICTEQRLIKYKQGKGESEQLHDLSFDQVAGISLVNEGRDMQYLIGAGVALVLGIIVSSVLGEPEVVIGILVTLTVSGVLTAAWYDSDNSHITFKGGSIIQQEPEQWRIQENAAEDPDEVREFVKTVRERLR